MLAAVAGSRCDAHPPAPTFDDTLPGGDRGTTVAMRGKVLLVHFRATSCIACVKEMPALVATHHRYQALGLETA